MLENEIPKYQKKSSSSVSASKLKSKHKHEYKEVLFHYNKNQKDYYKRGEYCIICGKLGVVHHFETKHIPNTNIGVMLTYEEVKETYSHLELKEFELEVRSGYVPI